MEHLLSCEELEKEDIDNLMSLAFKIRETLRKGKKKFSALRGQCVVNLFFEASTRTRTSFEKAGKFLSADVINISASTSSVKKGETLIDTVKNLDMMHPDIIVLRHPCEGAGETIKQHIKASIVNAGDGCHEHPSQALLDAMTIIDVKGSLKGLNVVIAGDIVHSRVARSDIILFKKLGANLFIFGPSTMMPRYPEALGVTVLKTFEEVAEVADVLILLRIQLERLNAKKVFPSLREYSRFFGLNRKRLGMMKKDVLVMHPGPVNRGVEINNDVITSDRTFIFNQVENGLAVRMAILTTLCSREKKLLEEIDA
ncbi:MULTISPECIES: aspartate carbamoyltransferase catalytic subunit [unclassified Desulfurobacterium]|uniref:aspartate carbamoyltransferase catalytic subunit n=1 Tax=Desulfurobacterium sp. TC5-1 TaxID=1158318 RepID=UPI0003B64356|nr:aspartate carbamoyltransferase catalytic subunit [Desulfurobacterium sp. TC5-1]